MFALEKSVQETAGNLLLRTALETLTVDYLHNKWESNVS